MVRNIIKGFIIGIAKIMPGVSGSILAISLNVYEKTLSIIANIKKINFQDFKFILAILIGGLLGICLFSRCIQWFLSNFYFAIMLLFIGLIIGGIPDIVKNIKSKKICFSNLLIFFIGLTFSYALTLKSISVSSNNIIIYFFLGLIEAFSTIIPGISGTAIYMSMGAYEIILNLFSNLFNPVYFKYTLFFGFGILVGTYLLAKIITYLLKNYKEKTYWAILGFMFSAVFILFNDLNFNNRSFIELFLGLIFLLFGFLFTKNINKFLQKDK